MSTWIGYFEILKDIVNIKDLLDFCVEKSRVFKDKNILRKALFPGIKTYIQLSWSGLIKEFKNSNLFNFKRDIYYELAFFSYKDLPLHKIPITCEKTAFLLGLYNLGLNIQ